MAHVLIPGITLSGKTFLAKQLARIYRANGHGILVLDELCDPDWQVSPDAPHEFQTNDPEEFLSVYWQSRQCMAFIDEAGDAIGHYDKAMIKTATRGRHWGHTNHYMVQRGAMISPTVRAQCTKIFCFCQSEDDAKILAKEFNKPELLRSPELKQGEYIYAEKMGRISFHSNGGKNGESNRSTDRRGSDDRGTSHAGKEEGDNSGSSGSGGGSSGDGDQLSGSAGSGGGDGRRDGE